MHERLPITRRTQVKVLRGGSTFYSPPIQTGEDPGLYSLTSPVTTAVEGGDHAKIQVYAQATSMNPGIVPFVISVDGISNPAERGVDYNIVDADGEILVGDYLLIPVGSLRAECYVKGILDATIEGEQTAKFRIVEENDDAVMTGYPVGTVETEIRIQDPTTTLARMTQNAYTVSEPGTGLVTDIEIGASLTTPALAEITIPVTVASSNAVSGTNFELLDTSIVIPFGDQSGSATMRILRDGVYTGNMAVTVQLEPPTGPATLVRNATTAIVNIIEQDPNTDYQLGFNAVHAGVITIQEGGPVVKAKVSYIDNIPNTVQANVDWELVEVDSSGVVLGSQITTSSTNPLVIPAGQLFGEIALQAPANLTVEGDRSFALRLTGVTGGPAYIGDSSELAGTLVDTTVARPKASWASSLQLSLYEGTTASRQLFLDAPAPNPITLEFARAGVAGVGDLSIGTAQFAAGETEIRVDLTAFVDTAVEGTEAATFTIVPRSDYDVGAIPTLTVNVLDPPTGTSTLEFKPAVSGPTLIDVVTGHPIGYRRATEAPQMTIGGMLADSFPVDNGRQGVDGYSYAWQHVVYKDSPTGQETLAVATGGEVYGPGYRTDNIDGLLFQFQTRKAGTQYAPHEVTLGDAVASWVNRSGHYIHDESFLLRPRLAAEAGTKHEHCCQIVLTVVRTPAAVTIHGILRNDGYKADATRGHFQNAPLRNEIDGKVSFDSLKVYPPANFRVRQDPIRQRCTASASNLIAADPSGKAHRIPPQRKFHFDFALVTATATEVTLDSVADSYLDQTGWAVAVDGPYAYYANQWFGARRARPVKWGPDYYFAAYPGKTGIEASKARAADMLARVTGSCRGATSGPLIDTAIWSRSEAAGGNQYGWFEPGSFADNYSGGGQMIFLRMGWDFHPDAMRAMQIWARHIGQCNSSHILNIDTGRPMDAETLATTNTVAPGEINKIPWQHGPLGSDTWIRCPWFVPMASRPARSDDPVQDAEWDEYSKRPYGREWNFQDPLGYSEGPAVEAVAGPIESPETTEISRSTAANTWGQADMDHFLRKNEIFATLAAMRNLSWAKEELLHDANHISMVWPHLPVQGVNNYRERRLDYFIKNFNLTQVVPHLVFGTIGPDSGYNQGGFVNQEAFSQSERTLQRGAGHSAGAAANAEAFCPNDNAAMQTVSNWAQYWVDTCNIITTPWGGGDRGSGRSRQDTAITPPFEQHFPYRSEAAYPGTVYSWQNAWPLGYSGAQGWHAAFFNARMFDLFQAKYPQSAYSSFRKYGNDFVLSIWREDPVGARPSGKLPCGYLLYSNGTRGQRDQVSTTRPYPYELIPGSPATSTLFRYIGESWGPTYAGALQAMEQDGRTDLRDEFLGYLNIQYGLAQGASVTALIAALVAIARLDSGNNPPNAYRTAMHQDLIGYLQGIE